MAAHLGAWAYSTGRYLCMFYAGEFEMYVSHALTAAWLRACMPCSTLPCRLPCNLKVWCVCIPHHGAIHVPHF